MTQLSLGATPQNMKPSILLAGLTFLGGCAVEVDDPEPTSPAKAVTTTLAPAATSTKKDTTVVYTGHARYGTGPDFD